MASALSERRRYKLETSFSLSNIVLISSINLRHSCHGHIHPKKIMYMCETGIVEGLSLSNKALPG